MFKLNYTLIHGVVGDESHSPVINNWTIPDINKKNESHIERVAGHNEVQGEGVLRLF